MSTPEGVPRLFDLVKVQDEKMKLAFFAALGNTIVAKDIDQVLFLIYPFFFIVFIFFLSLWFMGLLFFLGENKRSSVVCMILFQTFDISHFRIAAD